MIMTDQKKQTQMEGLATLLVLNDEIRKVVSLREFGFFKKNEPFGIELLAQSGTPELDKHALINQWLKNKVTTLYATKDSKKIHQINLVELNAESAGSTDWPDPTFPNFLLWCPLFNKADELTGGLLFLREAAFSDAEIKMIGWLIASYQYTWSTIVKHKNPLIPKLVKNKYFIAAVVVIILFPIRLSVLGTATVVPKDPVLINAPMEGVIRSFAVVPGQQVAQGELLFTLDKTDLESNAEVSRKELMLTQAKLRTAMNQGMGNDQINAEIPILKAQQDIDSARIQYTNTLLEKAKVNSPITGIVVFESKEDWVGQPVRAGERILLVADPKKVELKIMLPIANIIELAVGGEGEFFAFGKFQSESVKIKTLGYNAKLAPNKVLSYELRADFSDDNREQLGTQGTVRLYGRRVPLIYYILRRPLQSIRQSLGI
jgi:biotin carboxyl carrier protein